MKRLNEQYSIGSNTINEGSDITYLGMEICQRKNEGVIHLTQERYLEKLLSSWRADGNYKSPHGSELFNLGEHIIKDEQTRNRFRSNVMKIAYLAHRTRPDILLAYNFLSSQITRTTAKSLRDLDRVLNYLSNTRGRGLRYQRVQHPRILFFTDAAYACHEDGKGHTGSIGCVGALGDEGNPVGPLNMLFARPNKQKLVGRSSTEAELIAVHETYPKVNWMKCLLAEMTDIDFDTPILYQDNLSTIVSATTGLRRFSPMMHVNVRYFAIRQEIEEERIKMPHLRTELMLSDSLTKCSCPIGRILKQRDIYMNCTDEQGNARKAELGKLD